MRLLCFADHCWPCSFLKTWVGIANRTCFSDYSQLRKGRAAHARNYIIPVNPTYEYERTYPTVTLFTWSTSVGSHLKMLRVLPSRVAHGSPHGCPTHGYFSHQAGVSLNLSAVRASCVVRHCSESAQHPPCNLWVLSVTWDGQGQ